MGLCCDHCWDPDHFSLDPSRRILVVLDRYWIDCGGDMVYSLLLRGGRWNEDIRIQAAAFPVAPVWPEN